MILWVGAGVVLTLVAVALIPLIARARALARHGPERFETYGAANDPRY